MTDSEPDAARSRVVLVADDDRDIRELVATKLTQAGFQVISFGDGLSALEAARSQHPDVAILDVMMPGLSGLDVVRKLHEDPATASIPVILLTAKSQEFDVQAGIALGAADYVIKPFSPRELVNRVTAALSAHGA
jgi:DNA-binding response OmpR family regulator